MQMQNGVILTKVPRSLPNHQIKSHFAQFGHLVDYQWIGANPKERCTIALRYNLKEEANDVLCSKYHIIKGVRIRCRKRIPNNLVFENNTFSPQFKNKQKNREALPPAHPNYWTPRYVDDGNQGKKATILGLPKEITNSDLALFFQKFGPIKFALVKKDPITGISTGYGTVTFCERDSLSKLLCLETVEIGGSKVEVYEGIISYDQLLSDQSIRQETEKIKSNENLEIKSKEMIVKSKIRLSSIECNRYSFLDQQKNSSQSAVINNKYSETSSCFSNMLRILRTLEKKERIIERKTKISEVVESPFQTYLTRLKLQGFYKEYEAAKRVFENHKKCLEGYSKSRNIGINYGFLHLQAENLRFNLALSSKKYFYKNNLLQ